MNLNLNTIFIKETKSVDARTHDQFGEFSERTFEDFHLQKISQSLKRSVRCIQGWFQEMILLSYELDLEDEFRCKQAKNENLNFLYM